MDIYNLIARQRYETDRYRDLIWDDEFIFTGAISRKELLEKLTKCLLDNTLKRNNYQISILRNSITIYDGEYDTVSFDGANANPYTYNSHEDFVWEQGIEALEEEYRKDAHDLIEIAKEAVKIEVEKYHKAELAKKAAIAKQIQEKELERKRAEYEKLKKELGET